MGTSQWSDTLLSKHTFMMKTLHTSVNTPKRENKKSLYRMLYTLFYFEKKLTQRGSWKPDKSVNYAEYLVDDTTCCLTRLPHLPNTSMKFHRSARTIYFNSGDLFTFFCSVGTSASKFNDVGVNGRTVSHILYDLFQTPV